MAFGEIDPASARQHARRFARILKPSCVYAAITLMSMWSALALFFDLPFAQWRIISAVAIW